MRPRSNFHSAPVLLLLSAFTLGVGCGARTGLYADASVEGRTCVIDGDCLDNLFCNGFEQCQDGVCQDGVAPDCDDGDPCTSDFCSEDQHSCGYSPVDDLPDQDRDGWNDGRCGGPDCDDHDPAIHPEAPERCNGLDDNCDGRIDEPFPPRRLAEAEIDGASFGHALVWADEQFFLAWHSAGALARPLYLGRLNPRGDFLDDPLEVTDPSTEAFSPSIAWSGETLALAFQQSGLEDFTDTITIARYDRSGEALDSVFNLTSSGLELRNPRVAWSGTSFGSVFRMTFPETNATLLYLTFLGEQGEYAPTPRELTVPGSDLYEPHIVWADRVYAVVWLEEVSGEFQVRLALSGPAGEYRGETSTLARSDTYCYSLNVVWTGEELVTAWTELEYPFNARLRFVTATLDGDLVTPSSPLTPEAEGSTSPALVWTGSELGLVWVRYFGPVRPETLADLRFAWLTLDGELLSDPLSLTPPGSRSRRPTLAWSGQEAGISWLDRLDNTGDGVYYTRVCGR